jgi:hypothetical protein
MAANPTQNIRTLRLKVKSDADQRKALLAGLPG